MQFEEIVKEDSQMDVPLTGVPNDTPEDVDTLLKEGEDLNNYSDQSEEEDHPKYNWDEQAYQMNLIQFINEDKVIDTQMHIEAGTVNNTVELVYDHCTQMKDHARPSCKYDGYRTISVFWEIGGLKAHCLIDSGCEGIMISPEFTRAVKIKNFALEKPIRIQLAVKGRKSIINYGTNTTINVNGCELKEYFNVVNIDYYDAILGMPFPKKYKVIIDFVQDCLKIKDKIIHNQAGDLKPSGKSPRPQTSVKTLKPEKL